MQFTGENYELIDFGNGRKLEKVGGLILNRPCPGARNTPQGSLLWGQEDLYFELYGNRPQTGDRSKIGCWRVAAPARNLLHEWAITTCGITMILRPTDAGQIGIFPEHWQQWDWITTTLRRKHPELSSSRVLSLFAYTGATTLYLASRGVQVTHVDAAKPTVAWARENCQRSGLTEAPIRWLIEDAMRYVEREQKRGNRYDGIILDPPTYGHGAREVAWNIHKHLIQLLERCWELLSDRRSLVLLCGHSPGINLKQVAKSLENAVGKERLGQNTVSQAGLVDSYGRVLDCGFVSRFEF